MDQAYLDVDRLLSENESLARESRYQRTTVVIELFASTFLLFYWLGIDRPLPIVFVIPPVVLNGAAWAYWAAWSSISFLLLRRAARYQEPRGWRPETSAYIYDVRTRSLQRDRTLAIVIHLLTAAQFVGLAVSSVAPYY